MIILFILSVVFGIVAGVLGAYLTNWEREIYKNYFPALIWIAAIVSAIYFSVDVRMGIVFAFIFVVGISWLFSTKFFKKRK